MRVTPIASQGRPAGETLRVPLHPCFKLRLAREEAFFGPGPAQLLEQIDKTQSVRQACGNLGISYSKGWKMLELTEEQLGVQVVARRQGGKNGGSASLTDKGRTLLWNYRTLERKCQALVRCAFQEFFPDAAP